MFDRRKLTLGLGMATAVALTAAALIVSTPAAHAAVNVGEPAPDFTLTDSNGEAVALSDFAGQRVVLEWTNDGCPFVKKHYAVPPANMQAAQAATVAGDAVWLTIISSAPGKQGHADGSRANELTVTRGAAPTHVLLDPTGEVGQLYSAATTPHIFIIDENGNLVYQGAIDDRPSSDVSDIDGATNYVTTTFAALDAGAPVEPAVTKAYGCSVKYAD